MAEELYDGEFWLPSQFLADDNILVDCLGPSSDQSWPVESLLGSPETESDEDEFLAGLTRKMAHTTLVKDAWKVTTGSYYENSKTLLMGGSPQSTLCSFLGDRYRKQDSSRRSTNCSLPPYEEGNNQQDARWNLLYSAAGEVANVRGFEERAGCYQNRGILSRAQKPSPVSVHLKNPSPNSGFQSHPFNQFQTVQNQAPRMVQKQNTEILLSPCAWPTLQQSQKKPGSGMPRELAANVFNGNTGVFKRESTGTGVFIPQAIGTHTVSRKKQDAALRYWNKVALGIGLQSELAVSNKEVQLPQKWTY